VAILATEKEARDVYRDCLVFAGEEEVIHCPAWDLMTADFFTVQKDVEIARMRAFAALTSGRRCLVVTSLPALVQKTLPQSILTDYMSTISLGDLLDREAVVDKLIRGGYTRQTLVETKGDFSARGNILDIYPADAPGPYRIELMGDEVESIRQFDPATQRSQRELLEFPIIPVRELVLTDRRRQRAIRHIRTTAGELELPRQVRDHLTDVIDNNLLSSLNPMYLSLFYGMEDTPSAPDGLMASLLDFCSGEELVFVDDSAALNRAGEDLENAVSRLLIQARQENKFYLDTRSFLFPYTETLDRLSAFNRIDYRELHYHIVPGEEGPAAAVHIPYHTENTALPRGNITAAAEGLMIPLVTSIRQDLEAQRLVIFMCPGREDIHRMTHLMEGYGLKPSSEPSVSSLVEMVTNPAGGRLILREGKIAAGFRLTEWGLAVYAEEELFGRKHARRPTRPAREGYFLKSFSELSPGDYIVHKDHGIGVYQGLQKMSVATIENDYLLIEYAEKDRLYIPVDRLDQIQRYVGPEGYVPKIERLGGNTWEAVKERVKRSIREVAEELVATYAAREVIERDAFAAPDRLYEEFCATFEYEETPDQIKAIEDIHEDMSREKPMDRLICGDAGFGKTEVALRASFRAAMDGRQVAVLVPTTILAEQHYQTFRRRLQDYPLRIEVLNRLKSKKEQQDIIADVNRGNVDILIGTHRILQKDVSFRNLSLVIVDEEQRFGVIHKERLKKIRTLVDVLTLSATPIPRTLHLSLIGIRDLSIINTPPEDRQPIQTYVFEFNEETIRDAIRQELTRGGQVFFLHDRIQSIYTMARFIEKLVPEARIGVVHGRMKPGEIEDTMVRFVQGTFHVLVCTTIVASGVDIPSANTIIINRADRLGLSQLYQIRGRVGRGREEAFAYILVPRGAMLSRDAQKRLQTLIDFSEPGSGFRIASNDLEIRGTGNLLGTSQSGQVSAVGYELYTELMEKTIRELKGETLPREEIRPEIHLGIPAFIPEEYMADEHQRLLMYKRISLAESDEEIDTIREELIDCYGFIPQEVANLLDTIRLRQLLQGLKSRKLTCDARYLSIQFTSDSPVDPAKIILLTKTGMKGTKLTPELKLYIPLSNLRDDNRLHFAETILKTLKP
jgi:transcription-repair coupling factor (superfamily II helicase)